MLRDAIAELKALPVDAWERDVALPSLLQLRLALPETAQRTDEERELAMSTLDLYESWKQRLLDEGLRGATGREQRARHRAVSRGWRRWCGCSSGGSGAR